jgi:hypothetical protein
VAQQAVDLVERVVLVTAVPEGVLLDAAANLVDDLGAEPDHMEGVQDRDRPGPRPRRAVRRGSRWRNPERVQRRGLHCRYEAVGLGPAARPDRRSRSVRLPHRAAGRAGSRAGRGSGRPCRSPPGPRRAATAARRARRHRGCAPRRAVRACRADRSPRPRPPTALVPMDDADTEPAPGPATTAAKQPHTHDHDLRPEY